MIKREMNAGTRIGSMLLDHFVLSFVLMIMVLPVFFVDFADNFAAEVPGTPHGINWMLYYMLFGISLYFNKDMIQGKSIAKRVLKIEVVDIKTGEIASSLKCLIRNLTIMIWPIEVIVVLASPSRRIGDYIAGTRIDYISEERNSKPRVDIKNLMLSIVLGFALLYLGSFVFDRNIGAGLFSEPGYDPTSYNKQLSSRIENHLDSTQNNYIVDSYIRVYDNIYNDSLKYISATIFLNRNYINSGSRFDEVKQEIFNSMFEIVPKSDFILSGKFVYDGKSTKTSTKRMYDWRKIACRED